MMKNGNYWAFWILMSSLLGIGIYANFHGKTNQQWLMPGPLSNGHHQFAEKCEVCHTSPFASAKDMEQTCLNCHGDMRVKPNDSHPQTKFEDPRNADLLVKIDALHCVTCHTEHRPEITHKDGVSQPKDFCVFCHEDIKTDRITHKEVDFMSCKTSGCHNFHNNRAIYTDFLVKHLEDPDTKKRAKFKAKEFVDVLDELIEYPRDDYPIQPVSINDIDLPKNVSFNLAIRDEWHQSGHAKAGVNCSACHQPKINGVQKQWNSTPNTDVCARCHNLETDQFKKGKHGMRLDVGLSPMTPASARLAMKAKASHKQLDCNSCHSDHRYDVKKASVEACLACHDDKHSLAYKGSKHEQLWIKEMQGQAPENTGVSCATCHMPRIEVDVNDWMSRIVVNHNQSENLSPNTKMIRTTCLSCHGLNFSMKALSDQTQIDTNFSFTPKKGLHPSMDFARKDNERYLREQQALKKE